VSARETDAAGAGRWTRRRAVTVPAAGEQVQPPRLGVRTVPGWTLRAAFAAVALPLLLAGVPSGPWTAIAALLIAVAVWRPRWLTAWVLIGVLVLSSLVEPGTLSVRMLALVAGAHLLHLLGAWMLVVPAAARVQPAVLLPSLRRFVLVQVPVQALAAILLQPGGRAPIPVLAGLSGVALLAVVGMLLPPLLRRPPR